MFPVNVSKWKQFSFLLIVLCTMLSFTIAQDIIGCGGFVKSKVQINVSIVEVIVVFLVLAKCLRE